MQPYPHTYIASAAAVATGAVSVTTDDSPMILSEPPKEFGGPGNQWSPETLLCAAVADCFVLTFRSIARAAKLEWSHLLCGVEGTLERTEQGVYFTRFTTHATLQIVNAMEEGRAKALLEKAEHGCLVANSLRGSRALVATVLCK